MSRLLREKQNTQQMFSLFLCYLLVTCAVYIMPLLKFKVPYILAALLMLATLVPLLMKEREWIPHIVLLAMAFSVVAGISLLNGVSASFADAINNVLLRNVRFFLPMLWGSYALRYTTPKQQTLFLVLFSAMVVFIYCKTISALENDQWVARILAQGKESSSAEVNQYRLDNVGGFEYSYMMGIIALCLTWGALKAKKLWWKLLAIAAVVAVFYYIIQTMYTTLLLLSFIGIFVLLFLHTKNPLIKLLLITIAIVTIFSLEPILKYLSTAFSKDSLLNDKFKGLYYALINDDVGRVGSRPELMAHSFERWLAHPVFGSYDPASSSHSLLFSTLETGGIVGFIPWLCLFAGGYRMLKTLYLSRGLELSLLQTSFLYVFVLSILNPIGYVFEVTIVAFFITPIWSSLTADRHLI